MPQQRGPEALAVLVGVDVEMVDLVAGEREEARRTLSVAASATVTSSRATTPAKNAWSSASVCRFGRKASE